MALTELGVSIIYGGLTTFCSGLPLCFAVFNFCFRFGVNIMLTVVWALLWALVFFPALLFTVGPSGSSGDIHCLKNLLTCKCLRKGDDEEEENETAGGTAGAKVVSTVGSVNANTLEEGTAGSAGL